MELIEYIRDNHYRDIVEEKMEEIYKVKNGEQKVDRKRLWVRLGRGKPVGVIVSNGNGTVGWSLVKYPDQFNRETALRIARAREMNNDNPEPIPYKIENQIKKMLARSKKTFKIE